MGFLVLPIILVENPLLQKNIYELPTPWQVLYLGIQYKEYKSEQEEKKKKKREQERLGSIFLGLVAHKEMQWWNQKL